MLMKSKVKADAECEYDVFDRKERYGEAGRHEIARTGGHMMTEVRVETKDRMRMEGRMEKEDRCSAIHHFSIIPG